MTHSSAVVFFTFALCIFACVSASAVAKSVQGEAPAHIVEVARQTVEAAKQSTNKAIERRQEELNRANGLLGKVKLVGTEAQKTQSKAEKAAEGYETAEEIVQSIKGIYTTVNNLQISATDELQKTISNLGELLKEAETLKGECDTEIKQIHHAAEDYIDTRNKVPDLKRRAGVLENTIADIFSKINRVQSTEDTMEEKLKEAQLKSFHISIIVAVAQIDTMINNAESIVEDTQNKKNEVDKTVQEMKTIKTRATTETIADVNNLWKTAEEELAKTTGAVDKVNREKKAMKQQRAIADTALTNVQTAKKIDKAKEEVTKAEACVASVGKIVPQLQSAQKTAENSVTKTNDLMQKFKTALSTTTNTLTLEEVEETKKSDIPVQGTTEADQKDTTIHPTMTDREKLLSKDSLSQSNNSTQEIKDALSNGSQNVPTTALAGGKAPAPGAKNDSAMTVSVPLLVALIASAVLQ